VAGLIEFVGALPDQQPCMSQFELDADGRRLWVRLASSPRFTVTIDADAVWMLTDTLAAGAGCAVPCLHPVRGRWLLNASPNRLALDFLDDVIEITFTPTVVTRMVAHLRCCEASMLR
jgi:hypothetical protein